MITWNNAWQGDLKLLNSIKILLEGHDNLLNFLFHSTKPQLKRPSKDLLAQATALSEGEQILVQLALDMWDGSGKALFSDVMYLYGSRQYIQLHKAMSYLKS